MTRYDTLYHVIVLIAEKRNGINSVLFIPQTKGTLLTRCPFCIKCMSQGKQAQFYKTSAWVKCRETYLRSVGGLCEKCKARGLITPAVIVHHKIHLNAENIADPTVTLNPANLEALCRQCHAEEHGNVKRFDVLADGTVVAR